MRLKITTVGSADFLSFSQCTLTSLGIVSDRFFWSELNVMQVLRVFSL
jgi:hypothetical protein